MHWARPLPRSLTRSLSIVVLGAWIVTMGTLVYESYFRPAAVLAADLARYGSAAQWRGVYYRGTKVGFTVSQTIARDSGYELQEDGQLEMTLLGASSMTKIHTAAKVDRAFALQSFDFSMDPGTGAVRVSGTVEGTRLSLQISTGAGVRTQQIQLEEPPALALNLGRRLADGRLKPGARYTWTVFDPATLRNAPIVVEVGDREVVRAGDVRIPAFRVVMESAGLRVTSWVTDTGEIVREDSPLGLMTIRESADAATKMAVSGRTRQDMLTTAAVVPVMSGQIDDTRDVQRIRIQLTGADLSGADIEGVGQTVSGDTVEIRNPLTFRPGPADPDVASYLQPEAFIESDADEIRAEAEKAVRGARDPRARAEQLVRYVNGLLEKKPTISLPSAREVLRTKVGDCNEHTALYVAMARAAGLPSRIAVGLAFVNGAFYYHAWPEVYLTEGERGYWLPVDPTFNQFPADGTHLRLVRGGLDRQAAILPLIGRIRMTVLDLDVTAGSTRVTVGAPR